MRIVYVYAAPRDPALEREIADRLGRRFGPAEQVGATEAADGLVTVTASLGGEGFSEEEVAAALREHPRVVEAAGESFGEGA
jgi:hypothetical protein